MAVSFLYVLLRRHGPGTCPPLFLLVIHSYSTIYDLPIKIDSADHKSLSLPAPLVL